MGSLGTRRGSGFETNPWACFNEMRSVYVRGSKRIVNGGLCAVDCKVSSFSERFHHLLAVHAIRFECEDLVKCDPPCHVPTLLD